MSAKNIDRLSIRDLVVEELKHILEVEQMEDGKYRIVFAGGEHEMEEDMKEESYHDEEESSEDDKDKKAMKEDEEDEEKGHYDDDEEDKAMKEDDEEDEDEKKGFLSNKERELLYLILNKGR